MTGEQQIPETTLRLIRGQDVTLRFTLDRKRDVTGWTVSFVVRTRIGQTAAISKTATLTDTTYGVFTVSLAKADTSGLTVSELLSEGEEYYWDLKRTDSGANTVLAYGSLELLLNATS